MRPFRDASKGIFYRESIIRYQQRGGSLYRFGDGVTASLRDIVRRLRINQINFELQRAAVEVAISQVELARLRLQEPPRPNEQAAFGATTARDLVQALAGLLSAQNDFLSIWISQESLRRALDFDMGTLRLDTNGIWIDPGTNFGSERDQSDSETGDSNTQELPSETDADPEIELLPPPPAAGLPAGDPPNANRPGAEAVLRADKLTLRGRNETDALARRQPLV